MVSKCNVCGNEIINTDAYEKISEIEKEIEIKIDDCKNMKNKDAAAIAKLAFIEQLKIVKRCKEIIF